MNTYTLKKTSEVQLQITPVFAKQLICEVFSNMYYTVFEVIIYVTTRKIFE